MTRFRHFLAAALLGAGMTLAAPAAHAGDEASLFTTMSSMMSGDAPQTPAEKAERAQEAERSWEAMKRAFRDTLLLVLVVFLAIKWSLYLESRSNRRAAERGQPDRPLE